MRHFPLFTKGSRCPRCGQRSDRVPTPMLLRPVRWLMPNVRRRRCVDPLCGWRGFAASIPEQGRPAQSAAEPPSAAA
jgi:hypothetical protein